LEGTVLIFYEKNKILESETQIPVELVSIQESKKFRGRRLITALLIPLVSILFLGLSYPFIPKEPNDSAFATAYAIVTVSALFLSIVLFFIFFVKFFIKEKIVSFVISPDERIIEFWKSKKDAPKIDDFIKQIKQRQAVVEKPFEYPAGNSIYTSKYSPLLRAIVIVFIFTIPALITENLYLFFIVLLTFVWFAYKGVKYLIQPKEYRKAMSFYIKKEWEKATTELENLQKSNPKYLPAYTLLVGMYIHNKQFDNALTTVASLPHEYLDIAQDIHKDIWYFKRLYERRKNLD
jgi:hypothetical protein